MSDKIGGTSNFDMEREASNPIPVFEYWLDAWCVAWHHVGQVHASRVSRTPLGLYQLTWYQRGVTMGLLREALSEAREQAWLESPFSPQEMAAIEAAANDPGEPL